jgi:hypothetical protein
MTEPREPYRLKISFPNALAFGILVLLFSCSLQKKIDSTNYHQLTTPPNGVKVDSNLYCDQTEIANIYWLEYLYWVGRVYGRNSSQFRAAFPDTSVWIHKDSCLIILSEYYLRPPAYHDYPLVGVSQKQARDFSEWRSDRVFEALLIKNGVLEYNPDQNADMHFTIERYFNGEYNGITPDTNFKYYPKFRLPTLAERERIVMFSDSVNGALFDKCKTKKCRECRSDYLDLQINIEPCPSDTFEIDPTRNVNSICLKNQIFPNFKSNVSEWTDEDSISAGWSWADETVNVRISDTLHLSGINAWTGFRNVCEWKKIE